MLDKMDLYDYNNLNRKKINTFQHLWIKTLKKNYRNRMKLFQLDKEYLQKKNLYLKVNP